MKLRHEYETSIEYFIPNAELPRDPDQAWDYLMAIFTDVHARYPDAGITVTGTKGLRELRVVGMPRREVEELLRESEARVAATV